MKGRPSESEVMNSPADCSLVRGCWAPEWPTDQLLAMLPYKSLHLSSVKDRFGIYALIDKNENRDKNIRKPRASVRKQLSETKQAVSPKRAAARSKQHEMEV